MSQYQYISIESVDDVQVMQIQIEELVDRLVLTEFTEEIVEYVKSEKPQKLVISLGGVKRFSSEGIGSLLRIRDWVLGNDGELKLCHLSPQIHSVFKVSALDGKVFQIYETTVDAIYAF